MPAFTIHAANLAAAAAWVARVCPAKPATPILGGMLVDVDESEVRLTAYDYETAATVALPIMLGDPGRMLVSGKLLAAVAAAATKSAGKTPEVTVSGGDGKTAAVKAGRAEWTLPSLPVEDYPQLPGADTPEGEVSADELHRALARVMPAVDKQGQVPALGGVEFSAAGDTLTLAATDRFRLATANLPWKPHGGTMPPTVVPFALVDSAAKAITGGGMVRLGSDGATFTVATDSHTLTGRCIPAAFPKWRQLMPAGSADTVAVVAAGPLSRAADQASVMLEGTHALRLDFTADTVEVSTAGDDRSARADAEVAHYRGEPITVAVNPQFVQDALDGCDSDLVEIQFGANANRPILVLPVAREGASADEYRHLLMPVKL